MSFTDRPAPETNLADRLRCARDLAGFNQGEAAQSLGVTSAALSQYESGKRRIEAVTLDRLARLYGVPLTYFFAQSSRPKLPEQLPDWETALRAKANSLSIAGKAGMARLIQHIRNLEELYRVTETPYPGKPHPPFAALPKESYADYEVAKCAQEARRYYNLGDAPLLNIKSFLDAQGYQVFAVPFGTDEADLSGLFFLHPDLGSVVVFNEDQAYTRCPFTLSHEVAHCLFHWDRPAILCRVAASIDVIEDFANRFASYFLIPQEGLQERLEAMEIKMVKHPEEVVHIAHYFGVSFKATVHRLWTDKKLSVSKEEWRALKPLVLARTLGYQPLPHELGVRPLPPEERLPRIFLELSYRAIEARVFSLPRVAELLGISDLELEDRLSEDDLEDSVEIYA